MNKSAPLSPPNEISTIFFDVDAAAPPFRGLTEVLRITIAFDFAVRSVLIATSAV